MSMWGWILGVRSPPPSPTSTAPAPAVELASGRTVNTWIEYSAKDTFHGDVRLLCPPEPVFSAPRDLEEYVKDEAFVGLSAMTQGTMEMHTVEWRTCYTRRFPPARTCYRGLIWSQGEEEEEGAGGRGEMEKEATVGSGRRLRSTSHPQGPRRSGFTLRGPPPISAASTPMDPMAPILSSDHARSRRHHPRSIRDGGAGGRQEGEEAGSGGCSADEANERRATQRFVLLDC
ncbi:hypothetical protein E2562_021789 [Oryza meyeriana var. granulata]|uniref:Legume lectin domain-containing protein n=1 Tax=Oryza meyeriana var. granulata TaxID=110450 RepID=A0A6G1EN68_9ORYZ|nr:hypothetical protein E2562_021789 [Oryza meyeriana var. granulata]